MIVADAGIGEMVAAGNLIPTSRVGLARTGVGVGVQVGQPKPDISTIDALRQVLLERIEQYRRPATTRKRHHIECASQISCPPLGPSILYT